MSHVLSTLLLLYKLHIHASVVQTTGNKCAVVQLVHTSLDVIKELNLPLYSYSPETLL